MERTDNEYKQLIDELFQNVECVTYKDRNFASIACKTLNISPLRYYKLVSEMAREGYKYA